MTVTAASSPREGTAISLFKCVHVVDGEDLRASLCHEELSDYVVDFRIQS